MNILITICARGGSKGIPGKNIKLLNGKPLISYSIRHAKEFAKRQNSDIGLSTDLQLIKQVAGDYSLESNYIRPAYLAGDDAGKLDAISDLLSFEEEKNMKNYDFIIDLDVTSPLRSIDDLFSAFQLLQSDTEALNIFSVSPPKRNPYYNMVERKTNGYYGIVKRNNKIKSRQKAPKVYDMNASFYIYKKAFFTRKIETAISQKSLIFEMDHICFDLDDAVDFVFMDYLIKENLLDFKL